MLRSSPKAFRFLVTWLAAVCLPPLILHAEIATPVRPPPQPTNLEVSVARGGEVQIPLRVFGAATEQVSFKIRTGPNAGTLGSQTPVTREISFITYTHSGQAGHAEDTFTYSSRSTAGVSAPARVRIRITDKPALLIVPAEIDFGTTVIGRPVVRRFTLENRGGGVAEGVVAIDPPWELESGEPVYRLEPGEKSTMTVTFGPQQPRGYRAWIRYSSDAARQTVLRGEAEAPFTLAPAPLLMKAGETGTRRTGEVTVSSQLESEQNVILEAGEIIEAPEAVILAPGETRTITLAIPATHPGAVDAEVVFRNDRYATALPVEAPALAARIRAEPETLALGEIKEDAGTSGRITVTNTGGERTYVEARIPEPFVISGRGFTLEPGGSRVVEVGFGSARSGTYRAPLQLRTFDMTVEVPVSANVPEKETAAVPHMTPLPKERPVVLPTPAPRYTVPPVASVNFSNVRRDQTTMSWEPPAEGELTYTLEERVFDVTDDRKVAVEWIPVTDAEVRHQDGRPTVTFRNLRPANPYTVRIIAHGSEDGVSPPSQAFRFVTQPAKKFPLKLIHLLFAALAILIALQVWKRRGSETT